MNSPQGGAVNLLQFGNSILFLYKIFYECYVTISKKTPSSNWRRILNKMK